MSWAEISQIADVLLRGAAWLAGAIGIFRAGVAAAKFFNRAGEVIVQIPEMLEAQARAQQEMVAAHNRQADALERTASLVPILERIQEEREQIGTTLRVITREIRSIKATVTGDGSEQAD
jgi:hypothetical protein